MPSNNFAELVQIFFQYGPFFILPFLMVYALPRLYKRMKTAPKDVKPILKRNILIYQVLVILLVVFCAGYWMLYLTGPVFYYGEVINIDPAMYELNSPHLYMNSFVDNQSGEYVVRWIWKKGKDDLDAKINFVKGNLSRPVKTFYLYPDNLKRCNCRLIYSPEDGVLQYQGNPLAIEPKQHAMNAVKKTRFGLGIPSAYAQPREFNVDQTIKQLQAMDFTVRNGAVERVIHIAPQNQGAVIRTIRRGFEIIRETRLQSPVQRQRLYNPEYLLSGLLSILDILSQEWCTQYGRWQEILGEENIDLIVEAAGSQDPHISSLALNFLLRFRDEVSASIRAKLNEETYRRRDAYMSGAVNFMLEVPGQREYVNTLQNRPEIIEKQELVDRIDKNLKFSAYQLPEELRERQRMVIDMALKLKEENINFRWGGKNEKEGFDSSGFIAYIFNRTGLLEKPEMWWSGKIRSEMGEKRIENHPKEIGDLVFYNGGYVMLYLGDERIIGMTEEGIVISDYHHFRGAPIQVNKVNYQ